MMSLIVHDAVDVRFDENGDTYTWRYGLSLTSLGESGSQMLSQEVKKRLNKPVVNNQMRRVELAATQSKSTIVDRAENDLSINRRN